ncbi:uncharacterized protein LOC122508741 [Leptopilina heterotoma]|uniref:uncharacterized protein LOC122508741 n=1 Tax=Leptopilina heterotoma TaxID=63436 RepID=UPI001CA94DF3|nr:uncharacterized protein LOC122508741 [Leptopilina heterotoma]
MGHGEEAGGPKFTGLSRIFNSHTNYGRANVSKATLGSMILLGFYLYFKPSKKAVAK